MTSKREREEDTGNVGQDGDLNSEWKRQKMISPPPASDNSLLPGFNYGDDDEEEESGRQLRSDGRGHGMLRTGQNGVQIEAEEDEDEDDYPRDEGFSLGKRSREIEIRRDCPYLDTVNRQVNHLELYKITIKHCTVRTLIYIVSL